METTPPNTGDNAPSNTTTPTMPSQVLGKRDQNAAGLDTNENPFKRRKMGHTGHIFKPNAEKTLAEADDERIVLFDFTHAKFPWPEDVAAMRARLPQARKVTDRMLDRAFRATQRRFGQGGQKSEQEEERIEDEVRGHWEEIIELDEADESEDLEELERELFGEQEEWHEDEKQQQEEVQAEVTAKPSTPARDNGEEEARPEAATVETEQKEDTKETKPTAKMPKQAGSWNENFADFINRGIWDDEMRGDADEAVDTSDDQQASSDANTALPPSPRQKRPNMKRKADEAPPSEKDSKKRRDSKQTTPESAQQTSDTKSQPETARDKTDGRKSSEAKPMTDAEKLEASQTECRTRIVELEKGIENTDEHFFAALSARSTAEQELEEARRRLKDAEHGFNAAKGNVEKKKRETNEAKARLGAEKRKLTSLERQSEHLRAKARNADAKQKKAPTAGESKAHPAFGTSFFGSNPKPGPSGSSKPQYGDNFRPTPNAEKAKSGFTPNGGGRSTGNNGPKKAHFYHQHEFDTRQEDDEEDMADKINREAEESRQRNGQKQKDEYAERQKRREQQKANRPPPPPPRPAAPAWTPPQPAPPTPPGMIAPPMAIAGQSLEKYNNFWDMVGTSVKEKKLQTILPCPLPALDSAGLRTALRTKITTRYPKISTIRECLNTMHRWSLDNVIKMLAKIFFFEGAGMSYDIEWVADSDPRVMRFFGAVKTTVRKNESFKQQIKVEYLRWHSDKLDTRTGTKGNGGEMSKRAFVQSIWGAVMELKEVK